MIGIKNIGIKNIVTKFRNLYLGVFALNFIAFLIIYINYNQKKGSKKYNYNIKVLKPSINSLGIAITILMISYYISQITTIENSQKKEKYYIFFLSILLYIFFNYNAIVTFLIHEYKEKSKNNDAIIFTVIVAFFLLVIFIGCFSSEIGVGVFIGAFLIYLGLSIASYFLLYYDRFLKIRKENKLGIIELVKAFFMIMVLNVFMMVLILESIDEQYLF